MDETGERAGARGTREQGAGGGRAGGDEMGYTVGWGGSAFYDPPTPPRGDPTERHQVFRSAYMPLALPAFLSPPEFFEC